MILMTLQKVLQRKNPLRNNPKEYLFKWTFDHGSNSDLVHTEVNARLSNSKKGQVNTKVAHCTLINFGTF